MMYVCRPDTWVHERVACSDCRTYAGPSVRRSRCHTLTSKLLLAVEPCSLLICPFCERLPKTLVSGCFVPIIVVLTFVADFQWLISDLLFIACCVFAYYTGTLTVLCPVVSACLVAKMCGKGQEYAPYFS